MAKIDKTDLDNISLIKREFKLKNITTIKIKKGNYEIELSSEAKNIAKNVLNSQNKLVFIILDFTYRLTEPLLRKIRNFLPNLGALDISPVVLLFLIWILKMAMQIYIRPHLQI